MTEINKLHPGRISRVLLTFSIAVLALNMNAQAPKPPVPVEFMFGHEKLNFQLLYNTSLKEGNHNRSYVYLRAGLKRQSLIFGLGANLDQFGPHKHFEDNYGVFIGYELR